MAWLIGAIVTYGIVVLLIGISVMLFLFGDQAAKPEADDTKPNNRPTRHPARSAARPRQGVALGTGGLRAR